MELQAKLQKYKQQIGNVSLRWIEGSEREQVEDDLKTFHIQSQWGQSKRWKHQSFGFINHNSTIWFSHSQNAPTVLRGKILHESTDIHNVIATWQFFDQSTPRGQQTGFITHLRDCESSSLWLLLEGSLARGEQRQDTSAAARYHHVLCSHADAARWRRRAKRCTERSCSLSLHRAEPQVEASELG